MLSVRMLRWLTEPPMLVKLVESEPELQIFWTDPVLCLTITLLLRTSA